MGEVREGCTNLPNTQSQRSCDSDDLRSCDSLTELGDLDRVGNTLQQGIAEWGGGATAGDSSLSAWRSVLSLSLSLYRTGGR